MAAVGRLVWYAHVLPNARLFEMGQRLLCRVLQASRHSTWGGPSSDGIWWGLGGGAWTIERSHRSHQGWTGRLWPPWLPLRLK